MLTVVACPLDKGNQFELKKEKSINFEIENAITVNDWGLGGPNSPN